MMFSFTDLSKFQDKLKEYTSIEKYIVQIWTHLTHETKMTFGRMFNAKLTIFIILF